MAFYTARITSKDGAVVAEDVEVWLNIFRLNDQEVWDGSFDIPITTPLTEHSYRLHLVDGRQGRITNITTSIRGNNITVYFEGRGSLA